LREKILAFYDNAPNTQSIMTLPTSNFTHHCLIAMPDMEDSRFSESVTYIVKHDQEGAVGLVVNKPLELTLDQLLSEVGLPLLTPLTDPETPVLFGGPVSSEAGFVLHRDKGLWNSSLVVEGGLCVTSSRDILDAISQGKGPKDFLVVLGYAGWAAGQLEKEMAENSWLTCPADESLLFEMPYEQRWQAAASKIGVNLNLLTGQVGHA
jgi:putative transcriptional regulator